jgi:hypothetical protein
MNNKIKRISDLTDEELKVIYFKTFAEEDERKDDFYVSRSEDCDVAMGTNPDDGMVVCMNNNGNMYVFCLDNRQVYHSYSLESLISHLKFIGIHPFS